MAGPSFKSSNKSRKLPSNGLSKYDRWHYWATQAARHGTTIDRLQDAGGWTSPAIALRYIDAAKTANEGMNLGSD